VKTGDIVRVKSIKDIVVNNKMGITGEYPHKANKGELLVLMVLGSEKMNGENPVHPDDFLKSRWTPYLELLEENKKLKESIPCKFCLER